MRKDLEPTTMQTTKEIVNGIWSFGKEVYKGGKRGLIESMEEETLSRVREELNLKLEDDTWCRSISHYVFGWRQLHW